MRRFLSATILLYMVATCPTMAQLQVFKDNNGRFGYKDSKGTEKVAAMYDAAMPYYMGKAAVTKNGKVGILDAEGKELYFFDELSRFSGQILYARKGNLYGLLHNTTGRLLVEPVYDQISIWISSLPSSFQIRRNGKMGIMDAKTYKEILAPAYDSIKRAPLRGEYYYLYQNGKFRVMNTSMEILPGSYDAIWRQEDKSDVLRNGRHWYYVRNGKLVGLLDVDMRVILPAKFDGIELSFEKNGISVVHLQGKVGAVNDRGEEIIPIIYDKISLFNNDGISAASLNGKYGFIDRKGNTVIPFEYEFASTFSDGLAKVKLKGKVGYINLDNKMVIANRYEDGESFFSGLAPVKKKGRWGFINSKGKTVIPFKYKLATVFFLGSATVWEDNGKSYRIDKNGKRLN